MAEPPVERAVVSNLRRLCEQRADAVVHVGWQDEIVVRDGGIAWIGSARVPPLGALPTVSRPVAGSGWARVRLPETTDPNAAPPDPATMSDRLWERICRAAVVDAGLVVLDSTRQVRTQSWDIPRWSHLMPVTPLPEVLAETARRRRVLSRVAAVVTPESILRKKAVGHSSDTISLSAPQWSLLTAVREREEVSELAGRTAFGLFATTLLAYTLIRVGVLAAAGGTGSNAGLASGSVFLGAAVAPVGEA